MPGGATTTPPTVRSAFGPSGVILAWALPLVIVPTGERTRIFASILGNTFESAVHRAFSIGLEEAPLARRLTAAVSAFTNACWSS